MDPGRWAVVPGLAFALALAACSNKVDGQGLDTDRHPPHDTDTGTTSVDEDGDGFTTDDDCDDTNASIYPGAPELCDGLDDDCDGVVPDDETDMDGNGVVECEEECDPAPGAGTVTLLGDCEYTPSPSGTPFDARVEWSMTQAMTDPSTGAAIPAYTFADEPDYTSVFQAPAVGQTTDDDGDGKITDADVPDIAVVMADVDEDADGVLRLIAGDGSDVLASTHWSSWTNKNGTYDYAPYHYAGVAIGDVDGDGAVDVATLVVRSDGLCYPATYEVQQTGSAVDLVLHGVYAGANYSCMAHAPALADLDGDGVMEMIYGRAVFEGTDFSQKWYGSGGRGWYGTTDYPTTGYWNSGYHSFAYDVDGDGQMEVVAGKTVYNADGTVFCALGSYSGTTWVDATDGYPAIADIARFSGDTQGEPEIVVTGNEYVSVFHGSTDYDPNGQKRCVMIDQLPNDPLYDATVPSGLPTPASCDTTATAFGGPPTVADFDGDGQDDVGVAGACWYSVFSMDASGALERYAMAETRDWSSASTGSTVFDFNGDQKAEVVFSDEQAVYVWEVDTSATKPWNRLVSVLTDTNHKSWTVHEYPLVADVDGDGKAEIVAVNSHLPPDHEDAYGIYVLGAADDDWVSARKIWNQHAYSVTNVEDDGSIGVAVPNYEPYTSPGYDSFRQQAPGSFGSLVAANLWPKADEICQEGCGDIDVRVQVANDSEHVTADASVVLALYGVDAKGNRTLIDNLPLGKDVAPGELTSAYEFYVGSVVWSKYDHLVAVVDDPDLSGHTNGSSAECDETDNEVEIPLTGVCP